MISEGTTSITTSTLRRARLHQKIGALRHLDGPEELQNVWLFSLNKMVPKVPVLLIFVTAFHNSSVSSFQSRPSLLTTLISMTSLSKLLP